jgi:hypothetical protein
MLILEDWADKETEISRINKENAYFICGYLGRIGRK